MGILHYGRHFSLLGAAAAVLASSHRWSAASGAVAAFGVFGALHAATLVATLRCPQRPWRRPAFVVIGASLSMLTVALAVALRAAAPPGVLQPMLLVGLSSALGAAGYALLIRQWFAARLPPRALLAITLGCSLTSLAVLATGLYRVGPWCFAVTWWLAFSVGLWLHDGRRHARRGDRMP